MRVDVVMEHDLPVERRRRKRSVFWVDRGAEYRMTCPALYLLLTAGNVIVGTGNWFDTTVNTAGALTYEARRVCSRVP